jgi:hypothetical protein
MNNLLLVSLADSCTAFPDQADSLHRTDLISELSGASLRYYFPVSLDAEDNTSGSAPRRGKTYSRLDEIMMSEMIAASEIIHPATREKLL